MLIVVFFVVNENRSCRVGLVLAGSGCVARTGGEGSGLLVVDPLEEESRALARGAKVESTAIFSDLVFHESTPILESFSLFETCIECAVDVKSIAGGGVGG